MQSHFGGDVFERFHLKVRCTHPGFDCTERMFNRLAAQWDFAWVVTETLLHTLKYGFVFPSLDPALFAGSAFIFDRATRASGRPV